MNNLDSKLSNESVRNVHTLIQKIEWACADIQLKINECLNPTPGAIADFSVTTAEKVDSDFVDVIILNIDKIKNHLDDLKNALSQKVITDVDAINVIVDALRTTSGTLQEFLLSNNFNKNTFEMPIMEIQSAIDQIFEEVALVEYAK